MGASGETPSGPGEPGLSRDEIAEAVLAVLEETAPSEPARPVGDQLNELWQRFSVCHEFRPGELVKWKAGLRNKLIPAADTPAVVVEVLEEPVLDAAERPDSAYFREPLDLVLGVLDEGGDLLTFHYDSRRFEPYA
jgi:hypothetical protein